MTTKQGRGVTQAVAFDAATVGGAWVGVWGSIGELGAHYMCEVRFGSVLRFQLGVQQTTFLPKMKKHCWVFSSRRANGDMLWIVLRKIGSINTLQKDVLAVTTANQVGIMKVFQSHRKSVLVWMATARLASCAAVGRSAEWYTSSHILQYGV